jgi:HK97 gp10 family phage protein
MAKTTVSVTGLADLERRLTALSADMGGKIARGATSAGARVIQKDAKRRAPKLTGNLEKGIVVKREKNTQLAAEYAVGWSKPKKTESGVRNAYYGRMVEFGTVKMTAQPHIRPAFDSKKGAAVDKIAQVLKKRLDKVGA